MSLRLSALFAAILAIAGPGASLRAGAAGAAAIPPGATVHVTVDNEPAFTGSYAVDSHGIVHFKLPGDDASGSEATAHIGGMTEDAAGPAIEQCLAVYVRHPHATVRIERLPDMTVEVRGAAQRPGRVMLQPGARASDLLAACPPLKDADLAHVLVLRKRVQDGAAPQTDTLRVDVAAFLAGTTKDDPPLLAGDVVILDKLPVDRAAGSNGAFVKVVGEVAQEANVPARPGLRLVDAIAAVGGARPTADLDHVRIVRQGGTVLDVSPERAANGDATQNVELQPGDVVVVGARDRSRQFAVIGAVVHPQSFEWHTGDSMTVTRAVDLAGGVAKGGDGRTCVLRKGVLIDPAAVRDIPFDISRIKAGKMQDWQVDPGDAIIVLPHQHRTTMFERLLPLLFRFLPFGL